jgi:hypothetical protein
VGRARDNYAKKLAPEVKEQRLLIRIAQAKIAAGEDLTEQEALAMGFKHADCGPEQVAESLAQVIAGKRARGGMAQVIAAKAWIEVHGAVAPDTVKHEHAVTLDLAGLHDALREAAVDVEALEVGPGPLLPGVPGVDPVEPTGGSDARNGKASD